MHMGIYRNFLCAEAPWVGVLRFPTRECSSLAGFRSLRNVLGLPFVCTLFSVVNGA